jgi:hypothetical protein
MKKELKAIHISKGGSLSTTSYPFEQNKKAESINLDSAFYVHRESLSILPKLIISNLKQRLMIQPNDLLNIQSCANLRVLTGTAFYLYSLFSNGTMQGVI